HCAPGRGQLRVRIRRPQLVEDRRRRERDGITRSGRGEAPAVEDDQGRGRARQPVRTGGANRRHQQAALTIAANVSASRLAPPTSAPSTSGSASNSGQLSSLTLPPYSTRVRP